MTLPPCITGHHVHSLAAVYSVRARSSSEDKETAQEVAYTHDAIRAEKTEHPHVDAAGKKSCHCRGPLFGAGLWYVVHVQREQVHRRADKLHQRRGRKLRYHGRPVRLQAGCLNQCRRHERWYSETGPDGEKITGRK